MTFDVCRNIAVFNQANNLRLADFKADVESGAKFDLDLGCGDGEFTVELSRAAQSWVVGIDRLKIPSHSFVRFSLGDYLNARHFLYLAGPYSRILSEWDQYSWMVGGVRKTFLVFPYPRKDLNEEVKLWLKFSVPQGELHIRTEDLSLAFALKNLIPQPVYQIPFAWEAMPLSSESTAKLKKKYQQIYNFRFRLR